MSVNHKALRRWTEFILHGGWAGGREFSGSARRPRGMLVAPGDHSRIYKKKKQNQNAPVNTPRNSNSLCI